MATYVKFNVLPKDILSAVHNFTSDSFKVVLTNTAPVAASNEVLADITQIADGGGYTAGGYALDNVALSVSAGVAKVVIDDETITAAGGAIGPFRYLVVYNDTPTSPADPLCFYYDYGGALTLADGESLSTDFDGTNGVFTLA